MTEYNHDTLRDALRALPQHTAPALLWSQVAAVLDEDGRDAGWRAQMDVLPQYEPPAMVWDQIATTLDRPAEATVVRLSPLRRALPYAAALAALVAAGLWWTANADPDGPLRQYTILGTETAPDPALLQNDWDEDEDLIMGVLAAWKALPDTAWPSDEALDEELEELNAAKAELLALAQKYGQDPSIIQELKDIELQRTALVKRMATYI